MIPRQDGKNNFQCSIQMTDLRKLDPNFTSWVPKTAAEAIKIFYKRKELGEIIWDDLDLVFKELAQGLDQE